jgi:CRISPR/Cas system-associated endonuclease Cas1
MFNPFNLGSDLMEPFRILIDREIYAMKPQMFEHEQKMELVNVLNHEVMIEGRTEVVNNAIKLYCKSIFDALDGNDISLIKFYKNGI